MTRFAALQRLDRPLFPNVALADVYDLLAIFFKDSLTRDVDGIRDLLENDFHIGQQAWTHQNFQLIVRIDRQKAVSRPA